MNFQALLFAMPIIVKGMGGIFFVIALIYLTIALLNRVTRNKPGETQE